MSKEVGDAKEILWDAVCGTTNFKIDGYGVFWAGNSSVSTYEVLREYTRLRDAADRAVCLLKVANMNPITPED